MPRRIQEDHQEFRDIVSGKIRETLKKYIKTGYLFRKRGKQAISVPIPRIDLPRIVYGKPQEGAGRGPGKTGDIIGKEDPNKSGPAPGSDPGDGMTVNVDMEEILQFLKDELELPNLRSKPTQTYEEVKIKYNGLSKVGPRSLLHKKRTLLQCLKRQSASGELEKKVLLPGYHTPISLLSPINDDFRYRQWNEVRIPSSNAVVFFARDGSGSMGEEKCDIVSDMSWWIDLWIQNFYKKTERVYIWHDTVAKEVDEYSFYRHRYGGGTRCSSAVQLISNMLKHRYPPIKWNIYIFYFGDGENWDSDNSQFVRVIRKYLSPDVVNLFGLTQILAWDEAHSLKAFVDKKIEDGNLNREFVRTCSINTANNQNPSFDYSRSDLTEVDRNDGIKKAIKYLLSANPSGYWDAAAEEVA